MQELAAKLVAELIGTAILVTLGDGVVANVLLGKTKGHGGGWIVIATAWGLAVAVAVYSVGRVSGAHLNPAVTLAVALGEPAFGWPKVLPYMAAQIAGGFVGGVIVWLHYLPHWRETADPDSKLAVFATTPAVRHLPANLLSEVIGTFVLVFGVLAIAANAREVPSSGGLDLARAFSAWCNPFLVGVLVWVIGLSLGGTTGYAINPARDLGPRIAHGILPIPGKRDPDWAYGWIPVVGPLAGGAAAAFLFRWLDW
ncbi:MAG: aquaporin family protein [Planctomycetes bacterium]|nr:aquaporin family protein [Planctomycetota bacterium]